MKRNLLIVMLMVILVLGGCRNSESTPVSETEKNEQESIDGSESIVEEVDENSEIVSEIITLENVMNAEESLEEDFEVYNYGENEGVIVSSYIGKDEIVVIPSQIDGKDVVVIDAWAFFGDTTTAKAIVVPDTVFEIRECAFSQNETIEIIILGNGIKEIGQAAFFNTLNLAELNLPDGLESIGESAIWGTSINVIDVPVSVINLDYGAILVDTIIGESGSVAEEYATEWEITFQAK